MGTLVPGQWRGEASKMIVKPERIYFQYFSRSIKIKYPQVLQLGSGKCNHYEPTYIRTQYLTYRTYHPNFDIALF